MRSLPSTSSNPWYYSEAPHQVRPVLDIIRRQLTFEEVVQGLDENNALFEARRCLSKHVTERCHQQQHRRIAAMPSTYSSVSADTMLCFQNFHGGWYRKSSFCWRRF